MAAIFPTSVATAIQLLTAKNNLMVVLDANCGLVETTLFVDDASPLPASGYLTFVDTDEVIFYAGKTSNTLTGVVRGADGTAPASHLAGVDLEQRWNADYHNIVTQELISAEQYLSDRFGLAAAIVVPTGKAFTITDGLGIGAGVDAKAVLSLTSTTKGFLPPTMTTTQRDAITSPTNGLVIYNSTTSALNVYRSSAWKALLVPGLADIVNADIATGAAIAYSKLALTGAVLNADLAGSIAYSKLVLTGAVLNADLAGSIAYSKLVLTGAILNADLAGSIAYSKLTLTGAIVNADVSTSAAIALSKLAALTTGRALQSNASTGLIEASSVTATELGYVSGVTSALQTQINAIAGGSYLAVAGGTMTGNITFSPTTKGIVGTTTSDNAPAGTVGEAVSSIVATWASAGTSGQWADATSIALTAGDWDITLVMVAQKNGATVTVAQFGIGTVSGNTAPPNFGSQYLALAFSGVADTNNAMGVIPALRVSLASPATYYAKLRMDYSVATPQFACRLNARRIR